MCFFVLIFIKILIYAYRLIDGRFKHLRLYGHAHMYGPPPKDRSWRYVRALRGNRNRLTTVTHSERAKNFHIQIPALQIENCARTRKD